MTTTSPMPGVKIVQEEKVSETDDVEKTEESMIKLDSATLLILADPCFDLDVMGVAAVRARMQAIGARMFGSH